MTDATKEDLEARFGKIDVHPQSPEGEIWRLAALHPLEYERRRNEEAKRLGIRVSALDNQIKEAQQSSDGTQAAGSEIVFDDPEPWETPVEGAELLVELARLLDKHVALPKGAATASALWIMHTHTHEAALTSPILALTSPEKRCGKTTMLSLLGRLCWRPLPASNISPAALFRTTELYEPTLLIDEADTFLKRNDELRGVLNSGHTRGQAFIIRTVGEDHAPRRFSTWGPKAIALIGNLPPTLADRSLTIQLRRKLPAENIVKLRDADSVHIRTLVRKIRRWCDDNWTQLRMARPEIPLELHDRAADNWEPLLGIADIAGNEWSARARAAALELSSSELDDEVYGVQLLGNIRNLFLEKEADRIHSADLVNKLVTLESQPWSDWRNGKALTTNGLARLLRPFGIKSKQVRIGTVNKHGYQLTQFTDAFERYLPGNTPSQNATTLQANGDGGLSDIQDATASRRVAFASPRKASSDASCSVVANENGGSREIARP